MGAVYNEQLPYPVRDNYAYQHYSNNFSRVDMDDGITRQRREYSTQTRRFSLTWNLTFDELSIFEAWLEYDVSQMSGWFDLPLAPGKPTIEVRIISDDQNGVKYSFDEGKGVWIAKADCEYLTPDPVFPADSGAMPNWPTSLPDPEKSGYSYQPVNQISRSAETSALAQERVRFRYRKVQYTANWILADDAELKTFTDFVDNDLVCGTCWFNAPFANGLEAGNVRARFVSPPQAVPEGAAYTVTATLETADAPRISKLQYLTNGQITLTDSFKLVDSIDLFFSGRVSLSDHITLVDLMSILKQLADSFSLDDDIENTPNKTFAELVKFLEALSLAPGRPIDETLGFAESVSMNVGKALSETLPLSDSLALATLYKRTLVDTLSMSEVLSFVGAFVRTVADTMHFAESGLVRIQNYADYSYFADDYTGISRTF